MGYVSLTKIYLNPFTKGSANQNMMKLWVILILTKRFQYFQSITFRLKKIILIFVLSVTNILLMRRIKENLTFTHYLKK